MKDDDENEIGEAHIKIYVGTEKWSINFAENPLRQKYMAQSCRHDKLGPSD